MSRERSRSNQLALELATWFDGLIREGKAPPKSFTGITRDRLQFVCLISPLGLDRGEALEFMAAVLKAEGCSAFAHGMRVMDESGTELIDIFSGETGEYWFYEYQTSPTGLKLVSGKRDAAPSVFFQELPPEHDVPSHKQQTYLNVWQNIRPDLFWREWQEQP